MGALVILFGAFWSVAAALAAGLLLAALPDIFSKVFQVEELPPWFAAGFTVGGALIGASVSIAVMNTGPAILLSPLLTGVASTIWAVSKRFATKRCSLCNSSLRGVLEFECPRCALTVCEQLCWRPDFLRCRLCLQNEVPVFTPDTRWWDKQVSARMTFGSCQFCQSPAAEDRDLRTCRRCGRPQCISCWDHLNGQCSRCQWTIQELPEALAKYVGKSSTITAKGAGGTRA